jgi:K+-transporting ATPase KdpF subunit
MTFDYVLGGITTLIVFVYVLWALLRPERF